MPLAGDTFGIIAATEFAAPLCGSDHAGGFKRWSRQALRIVRLEYPMRGSCVGGR